MGITGVPFWSYGDETRTNRDARKLSFFWKAVNGGLVFVVIGTNANNAIILLTFLKN